MFEILTKIMYYSIIRKKNLKKENYAKTFELRKCEVDGVLDRNRDYRGRH